MNPARSALQAEHGSRKHVLLPAAVAALGGLLFGFSLAESSPTYPRDLV
jgi:hypothetical protein